MTPTTIADPSVGLFDGRYELRALIGQGLFGEVWNALDTTTGRTVALKLLDGSKTTPDAAWREATSLTALESPLLVRVHGAALALDVPYLDTELAVNGAASAAASPFGVAPFVAVRWTRQVAQGLHLCHQRGLLHRDVKPANVFLDANRDARLGDFGEAAMRAGDGSAAVGGDPQIRAPEVLKGGRCTVGSEVYSAGMTLHALLTGRLPFRWEDFGGFSQLRDAALGGPPDIREVSPHVDIALAKVVRKSTSLNPASRYSSAAELDAALSRLSRGTRDLREIAPHPGATRCWAGEPGSSGPTPVHVCVTPDGSGRFQVLTRYVPSGNRITAGCGPTTVSQLPTVLRRVLANLR